MDGIVGHTQIQNFFDRVIASNRLSHAYCFTGPAHVGKRHMAEAIAAHVLHVAPERLHTHPDIKIIAQEFDEKKGKTKRDIDVDQAEELRAFISLRPFLGGYKVAIVDGAHHLNVNSANALLKTIEEPTGKTIMFFLTIDEDMLPLTIRSRCQCISFQPVPDERIRRDMQIISEQPVSDALICDANGLPGLICTWINDPDAWQQYRNTKMEFQGLLGESFAEKCRRVEAYFESGDDHIAARSAWQERLQIWQLAARELRETRLSLSHYLYSNRRMREAITLLDQNVHPRLAIEHILLSLP